MFSFFIRSFKEFSRISWCDFRSSIVMLIMVVISVLISAAFFAFIDFLSLSAVDIIWGLL